MKSKLQQTRKTEVGHEVVSEVAVVAEASPHAGLQPLVLLVKDEELTVKPVGPEKMARLGMQLHETDHLSKRGDYGRNYTRCFTPFMTFITSTLLLCSGTLHCCGVVFVFVLL